MFPFLLDGALLEFVVSTPKIGEFSLQFAVAFKAFRGKSPIANRGLNLTLGLAFMAAVAEVAIGRERSRWRLSCTYGRVYTLKARRRRAGEVA